MQVIIELEMMFDYLHDFEIVDVVERGNSRMMLRIRGFFDVQFEIWDMKIEMNLFIPEIEYIYHSNVIMSCDFVEINSILQ